MTVRSPISLVLVCLGLISAQDHNFPAMPDYSSLGNGLKIMAVELPRLKVATVSLIFKTGADIEEPDQRGWYHLLEHMLWKGHDGYPRQIDFLKHSYATGVSRHSETKPAWMRITLSVPTDSLQIALVHLLEIVRTPLIDAAQLDREKRVILLEWDRLSASPMSVLWQAYDDLVEENESISERHRDILFEATAEKIRLLRLRNLLPNNAGLVVASSHPTDAINDMVRLIMGSWPSGFLDDVTSPSMGIEFPKLFPKRDTIIVRPLHNPRLLIGWDAPPNTDLAGTSAAKLLVEALDGPDSPFYMRLVDGGRVLELDATYRTKSGGGTIVLDFVLPRDKPATAQAYIYQELRKLADATYLGPLELRAAKSRLERAARFMERDPAAWVDHFGEEWAASKFTIDQAAIVPVGGITQSQVFELQQTFITGIKPYVVLMLDQAARDSLPGNQNVMR